MGRFFTKPFMNDGKHPPPKLEWFKLYHGYRHAGDVLASFELIYKQVFIIKNDYLFSLD
jgi:hypothetical protein